MIYLPKPIIMHKNQITPEIKQEINKVYKESASIRNTRDIVNKKLKTTLTYHNVRDNIWPVFDEKWKELPKSREEKEIAEFIGFMKERNITTKDLHEHFYNQELEYSQDLIIRDWVKEFEIWVVSDTHLWAKTCALSELHHFYKTCKERWITDILHAGDLSDWGWKVYPWQLSELAVFGYDDMLEYLKDNYPKQDWIKTHFILGNHDEDFLKHWWANIGKALSMVREDMNYLGFYDANVIVNWVKIGLHHWAGGWSYAQSYKIQKYVETLTGERKPQLYILGHYHWSLFMSMRNIHCLLPACFQKPNNFSVRLNLPNIIGWYIIKIKLTDKNEVREITPVFLPYYIK